MSRYPIHEIEVDGRPQRFLMSDRFGPVFCDTEGMPTASQPDADQDPFWTPFEAWLAEQPEHEEDAYAG